MGPRICFFEDEQFRQFFPLTYLRPVYCLRAGILPLFRRAERYFERPEISLSARHDLAAMVTAEHRDYPVNIIQRQEHQAVLFLNGRIRSYGSILEALAGARLVTRIVGRDSELIGVFFPEEFTADVPKVATPEQYQAVYAANRVDVSVAETDASLYNWCWDLVSDIDQEIAADFAFLQDKSRNPQHVKVYSGAYTIKPEQIHLGNNVEMLPGSLIDASRGPVYIGDNTRIESQVAIYGPCYVGPNSILVAGKLSGSSIGHTCRVGGEVEESVFQAYVNKYHAGFIGHAYVGAWVNFGAMTTNSDLKNNYSAIAVSVGGTMIDTGSIKVGSFVGDHTKFGIGTLLNTGVKIGVCCNIFGGTLVTDREVPSFKWGNSAGYQTYRFDQAITTIRRTAERRAVTLTQDEVSLLQKLSEGQINEHGILSF
ncbi:MAG: putative sugar nucleotidyl transferase [Candidatus Zixiibacteriota bacterium]